MACEPTKLPAQLIRLNVGGRLFQTSSVTLASRGENFFTLLTSGRVPALKDENDAFFIDRNPEYFEPILEFLRSGRIVLPKGINTVQLYQEAQYYMVDMPIMTGDSRNRISAMMEKTKRFA